jgi:hypothetical protein
MDTNFTICLIFFPNALDFDGFECFFGFFGVFPLLDWPGEGAFGFGASSSTSSDSALGKNHC